jgi:hypothetical protein
MRSEEGRSPPPVVLVSVALVLTGVVLPPVSVAAADDGAPRDVSAQETPVGKSANVSSTLVELVRAEDRESFAAAHGIEFEDGRAVVVVELRDRSTLPEGYDARVQQTATVDGRTVVQALVPVDRILALSEEPGVEYVRLPERADAGTNTARTRAAGDGEGGDAGESENGGPGDGSADRSTDVLIVVGAVGLAALAVGLYGRQRG